MSGNQVVEAAAGTGKTERLVLKFIESLLVGGIPISKILALTFTEKAANEMRARLTGLLGELARGSGEALARLRERGGIVLPEGEARSRAGEALRRVDEAAVSTIHSFCATVLRLYPLESGVPPGFEVDDGTAFERAFEQKWRAFVDREMQAARDDWRRILRQMPVVQVRRLAEALCGFAVPLPWKPVIPDLRGVEEEAARLLRAYGNRKTNDQLRSLQVAVRILRNPNEPEALSLAEHLVVKPPPQKYWKEKEAYVRVVRAARVLPGALLLRTVAERLTPFAREFRRALVHRGILTFDALLWFVRDLLRDHRAVRIRLKEGIQRILVDEFQDTDPVQYDILLYLAERKEAFERDARKVELEPGKLFLVGDPKQSIYAFRGADMGAYEAVRDLVGGRRTLERNFRSRPEILGVVNQVFGKIMQERPGAQPAYVGLKPTRGPGGRVQLVRIKGEGRIPSDQAREIEAEWIGTDLARGGVRWSRCAVLLRTFSNLHVYLDALRRRRLPYVVQGGSAFYASPEMIDLVNLLVSVLNPHDPVALAGFLRSPLAACEDPRVHRTAAAGELDYRRGASDGEVAAVYRILAELHAEAPRLRPDELLDRLLERFHVLEIFSGTVAGAQAVANVMKLRQMAAEAGRRAGFSTREWVGRLRRAVLDPPKDPESPIADERLEAIRVMTIHAAKGLEFDTVYVPDLHGKFLEGASGVVLHDWAAGRVGVVLSKTLRDLAGDVLEERLRERQREEQVRLLYVAMTRARERLVLTGAFEGVSHPCFARLLAEASPSQGVEYLEARVGDVDRGVRRVRKPEFRFNADAVLRAWRKRRRDFDRARETPCVETPSSRREAVEKGVAIEDAGEERPAATIGSIVHRVLERADFRNLRHGLRGRVERAAAILGAGEEAAGIARRILEGFAGSDACARIANGRILGREVPFSVPSGSSLLAGRVDLLLELDGEVWAVDFKTGGGDPEVYRGQLETYGRALRELGLAARVALVRIETGEWVEPVDKNT